MNDVSMRIKYLRKEILKMTQREFSAQIRLSQNFIAQVESGTKFPSDRTINDICREFNVNEVWLRTGEGGDDNIFSTINPEDRYSINLGKLSATDNKIAQNMINAIAETDPEKLECVAQFMMKCLGIEPNEKS